MLVYIISLNFESALHTNSIFKINYFLSIINHLRKINSRVREGRKMHENFVKNFYYYRYLFIPL